VAFLLYSSLCAYIGIKLFGFLNYFFPGIPVIIYWIVYAFICFALVFISFSGNNLSFLQKAGSIWMAVFFYMIMLLAVSDVVRLCLFIFGKHINNFNLYAVGESLFLCVILIVFGMLNAHTIRTVNYDITLSGKSENLRIALVSDLHIGSTVNKKR
jgi:hypothetical protein